MVREHVHNLLLHQKKLKSSSEGLTRADPGSGSGPPFGQTASNWKARKKNPAVQNLSGAGNLACLWVSPESGPPCLIALVISYLDDFQMTKRTSVP